MWFSTVALLWVVAAFSNLATASPFFFGTNLYFLQGLPDAKQDSSIQGIASLGVNVLRVWVNGQSKGCVKGSLVTQDVPPSEQKLRSYNYQTLDALDNVIFKIANKGMKVIISPHDANSLLGNYRNFNIQNEPMTVDSQKACKAGDPHNWLCGRAQHIKSVLGSNNPILVSTGAVGGDISWGCTFIRAVTQCKAIDIISIHRYAGFPGQWNNAASGWIQQSNGKRVLLEEWGLDNSKVNIGSAFTTDTNDLNSLAMPNLYWQILPAKDSQCADYDPKNDSGDKFGIFINGAADIKKAATGAQSATAKQDWSIVS